MNKILIGIVGANGKLGRSNAGAVDRDIQIIGAGRGDDLKELFGKSDVVIDVSLPTNLPNTVKMACEKKRPLVVGTTGHDEENLKLMRQASEKIPLFYTPNFSIGVAAVAKAAALLKGMLDADISIEETHHVHKKDKPSGTALRLAEAVGTDQIVSHRVGEVVGDHVIKFSLDEEEIILSHRALSRMIFAKGALRAAKFLVRQPAGFYSMDQLLHEDELCAT